MVRYDSYLCTFNISNLCIWYPCWWPHRWLKHVGVHCMYKRILVSRVPFLVPLLYTYLLTPWSRVLLEKLTGSAASQEIPPFYGTRKFITVLISPLHLSLSWANSIQSPQPPPTSWSSILILSSHLCLGLSNGHYCIYI